MVLVVMGKKARHAVATFLARLVQYFPPRLELRLVAALRGGGFFVEDGWMNG